MMKNIKKLKGTKITHYRYKKINNKITNFKFYFKNGRVLKVHAPNGLNVNINKLQKLIQTKILEVTIKNDMVKFLFKNNAKMKFKTDLLWYKMQ